MAFGRCAQGNAGGGEEEILWRVLANNGERALMISEKALDCRRYHEKNTSVTWETSTLRKWLNGDFLNMAFTAEEQARLETNRVSAMWNPNYPTNPGNDTQDKVYLLSIDEASRYFSSDKDRICCPTAYAEARSAYTNSAGACSWWLRTPGGSGSFAALVDCGGSIDSYSCSVNYGNNAVRPVVVLRFDASGDGTRVTGDGST